MFLRALALLVLAVGLSLAATIYFGHEVLIALGLILTQAKIVAKKLASLELPAMLAWLKTQATAFFQFELLKKWFMTTLLPLLLGKAVLRRLAAWIGAYTAALTERYLGMLRWFRNLHPAEKLIAAVAILFATLALSVTSLGLWLILFSVKLPLWVAAAVTAAGRMIWTSVQKMIFRAVAFFQLTWLWRLIRRVLPQSWLERKRRFDYRIARAVIRRRRMTIRQLTDRKDSLPFRLGIMVDYLRGGRS